MKLSFSDVASFHLSYAEMMGVMRVFDSFSRSSASDAEAAAATIDGIHMRASRLPHPDDYQVSVDPGMLATMRYKRMPSGYYVLDVGREEDGHCCTELASGLHCDVGQGDILLATDGTLYLS